MKLKDLLKDKTDIKTIMYRTNCPMGNDMLAGYCALQNGQLVSLDGDDYSLDDEFERYEWSTKEDTNELLLTVWYQSTWI